MDATFSGVTLALASANWVFSFMASHLKYFSQSPCAVLAEQWTCISCGCKILRSHPDPGIKSFPCINFSFGTLFIQKLHLTDPAPGTRTTVKLYTNCMLTEPSDCDSWSGLKSKWCTQGGLILASSLTDPLTEQSSCGSRSRVLIRLIASTESTAESHGRTKTDENGARAGIVSGLKRAWKEFSDTRRKPAQWCISSRTLGAISLQSGEKSLINVGATHCDAATPKAARWPHKAHLKPEEAKHPTTQLSGNMWWTDAPMKDFLVRLLDHIPPVFGSQGERGWFAGVGNWPIPSQVSGLPLHTCLATYHVTPCRTNLKSFLTSNPFLDAEASLAPTLFVTVRPSLGPSWFGKLIFVL